MNKNILNKDLELWNSEHMTKVIIVELTEILV